MSRFKKSFLFLIFNSLTAISEVKKIENFLEETIPTIEETSNNDHRFFYFFNNQNDENFLNVKKSIQKFNLEPYITFNYTVFETCHYYTTFFNNLVAMKKYTLIANFLSLTIEESQNELSKIIEDINKIENKLINFKKKCLCSNIVDQKLEEIRINYIVYIDNNLNNATQHVKQKIYDQFDYNQNTYMSKKSSELDKNKLITSLVIASVLILGYYLFLTQTKEITKKKEDKPFFKIICDIK